MAIGSIILTLLASFAMAAPAAAQQTRASVRAQESDSLVVLRGELQRVAINQEALTRAIALANSAMRRAANEDQRTTARMRLTELSQRLEQNLSTFHALQAHLRAMCADRPAPEGWLGINISETMDITASPNATSFVYKRYPTLLAVEPGSPAQKAGLASGDEIVALGGRDMVSGPVDITSLLKPGSPLAVRIRRDGELRTVNVVIEPRPAGFISSCPWIEINAAPAIAVRPKLRVFELPNGGVGYALTTDSSAPMRPGRVTAQSRGTPVLPPTPYAPFRLRGTVPGSNELVAGAVLMPLSEVLREGLGLDEGGILVLEVLRGSPALEAGLRAGDVILRLNGEKLQSIVALQFALDQRDREVELVVSRRNVKRSVSLRP
jgi:C-terminal processing protease CtpA/Prc